MNATPQEGSKGPSLSRRLITSLVAIVFSLAVLATASVWGILGVRATMLVVRNEYVELRGIQEVERHVASVDGLLRADGSTNPAIENHLGNAIIRIDEFLDDQQRQFTADPSHQDFEERSIRKARADIQALLVRVTGRSGNLVSDRDKAEDRAAVAKVMGNLERLAGRLDGAMADAHLVATNHVQATLVFLATASAVILLVCLSLCIWQYRSVILPLRRLRRGVRGLAARDFSERLNFRGDREFTELSDEFDRMAQTLDDFCHDLEGKVRDTSLELVRSERLASVGYLAAGVAHEINNPLSIITGYAELSLHHLERTAPAPRSDGSQPRRTAPANPGAPEARSVRTDVTEALRIIRDEGFRCKAIIEKLLSLSRSGGDSRERVSVADVARDVVSIMASLKPSRGRRLCVEMDRTDDLDVLANEAELKQVLLNLLINALESVELGRGEVLVRGKRVDGDVMLTVSDNGCGMDASTLEHAFEPFFTYRRNGAHGAGLGLSITHAIVEAHGGHIRADSAGSNKGSRFTIRLPAYESTSSRD